MKKLLIATNLLTLIMIYFLQCTPGGKLATKEDGSFKLKSEPAYASCYNCITDDLHGETANEFAEVTARYRDTHQELYNSFARNQISGRSPNYNMNTTFKDARSCWFSADTLKKFICLMEKYAGNINIPISNLGVRFYYANYGPTVEHNQNFNYHHTLYMVPTAFSEAEGNFVDFEPRKSNQEGRLMKLTNFLTEKDILNSGEPLMIYSAKSVEQNVTLGNGSSAKVSTNQGDLCPPSRGCDSILLKIDAVKRYPSY